MTRHVSVSLAGADDTPSPDPATSRASCFTAHVSLADAMPPEERAAAATNDLRAIARPPTPGSADSGGSGGFGASDYGGSYVRSAGRSPMSQTAGLAAASALQDYKAKAKALRAREFELERSLKALTKYTAVPP